MTTSSYATAHWFKSSYSTETSGAMCVEVADFTARIGIRDSKHPGGPAITVSPAAWSSFIRDVQSGTLGH
ncbi:DUF397 domain-containing protein [Streptomyces sp. NPDC020379]|uniref:DUF397 domain-containing protein n=1 Tax=Streptomyces sp. NPDC020379 TaxID=3365071 RepID=UPI00379A423A